MGAQRESGVVAVIARRRRWGVADARIVIRAWHRSRESQVRFAQRYRLDPQRIARWASRLAQGEAEGATSASVRFHPVRVISSGGPVAEGAGAIEIALEIALGDGRTVRVPPGFAAEDLARAVGVLTTLTTLAGTR